MGDTEDLGGQSVQVCGGLVWGYDQGLEGYGGCG